MSRQRFGGNKMTKEMVFKLDFYNWLRAVFTGKVLVGINVEVVK
jgi:hypothetical protein